jgi:hypothetical protein
MFEAIITTILAQELFPKKMSNWFVSQLIVDEPEYGPTGREWSEIDYPDEDEEYSHSDYEEDDDVPPPPPPVIVKCKENLECPICLEAFTVSTKVFCFRSCGQQFHKACYLQWKPLTCPMCRSTYGCCVKH